MIDRERLLSDLKRLARSLVEDLRARTEDVADVGEPVKVQFRAARAAGRTDRTFEEWREDLLAQVAVAWILASVFVRFCEDNGLYETPLLSGGGDRRRLAGDHRADWLAANPEAGDREWLEEVFGRYQEVPATADLFGEHNPLWQFGPTADGAREILDVWQSRDDDTGVLVHDFTDPGLDTRFLGDLYQDLSDHAKKTYALLQTPEFVEEFILDRTLDPAIETFGLAEVRMIDPTCGSGHFLLGAFERILARWREREPGIPERELVQRALDAVNGVDLNPFAVAVARFRLLVAAIDASRIKTLHDAPRFRINVAVGDSLLHGRKRGELFAGVEGVAALVRHRYPTEDERANELLEGGRYHAVVGNPPYITVKDPALRSAYRSLYESCHGQYSLGAPFTERFFDLAADPSDATDAGYVGLITTNTFMKRQFGRKLVEEFLPTIDLTHIIDTSGAYIPGHGTPTVVLFGRRQRPVQPTIRAVLGVRGEPQRPDDPASGHVWNSIVVLVDQPGCEGDYVSVEDAVRERFTMHPWTLQGGAAPGVKERLEVVSSLRIDDLGVEIGRTTHTGEDQVYRFERNAIETRAWSSMSIPLVIGENVRNYHVDSSSWALFPYDNATGDVIELPPGSLELHFWTHRCLLRRRLNYGQTNEERGLSWWEYSMFFRKRFLSPFSLAFAFVATHNHFVLDRGGKVFNRSAPVIKLPEAATEDDHLELLGLLNSSTACFWMKQMFHGKGQGGVGQESRAEWEEFLEFDGTKLKQFPIPAGSTLERAAALDRSAEDLYASLPAAVVTEEAPTTGRLGDARERAEAIRAKMVALQEELDWRCYALYGLTEGELTLPAERVPRLERGLRAFEIVLARRMASGEVESTWFERHGSTPRVEIPADWPDDYQELVRRRIELIESDRAIGLLERPEYKRRWNWDAWEDLERDALRAWLLDRLEEPELWREPRLTTAARLTDRVRGDPELVEAARLLAGRTDIDLTALVADLVDDEAVPFAAGYRYTAAGMRKRREWEAVWDLQRAQDAIDARVALPEDHPDRLTADAGKALQAERGLDRIPVPPKYRTGDFKSATYWRLRGKLDVPKERFVLYPGTQLGADSTPVIGWAGWDHLQQARALAAHYHARKDQGADAAELLSLLAGLQELVPWLIQWHNELDARFGQRMGDVFAAFVAEEARSLGETVQALETWTPD